MPGGWQRAGKKVLPSCAEGLCLVVLRRVWLVEVVG